MILGQTPRAPVFSGVRPLFYQVVGSDPEFQKRAHEASDPLLQNAKLFLRAPLGGESRTSQLKRTQGNMQAAGETVLSKA